MKRASPTFRSSLCRTHKTRSYRSSASQSCAFLCCALILLLLALPRAGHAQASAEASHATPTLTSGAAFWEAAWHEKRKNQLHEIALEVDILFYDPEWNVLWIRDEVGHNFLPPGTQKLPFASGQRVRIQGKIIPLKGLNANHLTVDVLEPKRAFPVKQLAGSDETDAAAINHIASIDAYVEQQLKVDDRHTELRLIANGQLYYGRIMHRRDDRIPMLERRFVQLQGLLSYHTPDEGKAPERSLWIDGFEQLKDASARKPQPISPTLISELGPELLGQPILLSGQLSRRDLGTTLTIDDGTGELTIQTEQSSPVHPTEQLELTGILALQDGRHTLLDPIYHSRTSSRDASHGSANAALTSIEKIWELSEKPEAKDKVFAVDLQFKVMHYDPYWDMLWVDHRGRGHFLHNRGGLFTFKRGDVVNATGTIVPSQGLDPQRITLEFSEMGTEIVPLKATGKLQNAASLSDRFISLEGYAYEQKSDDANHLQIQMVSEGKRVTVRLLKRGEIKLPDFRNRLIRASGIFAVSQTNLSSQKGLSIWSEGLDSIDILPPQNSFSEKSLSIANLKDADPQSRVTVEATLFEKKGDGRYILSDETGSLEVTSEQDLDLKPDATVQVSGYPIIKHGITYLHNPYLRPAKSNGSYRSSAGTKIKYQLNLAGQVLQLDDDEIGVGHRAELKGVVTYVDPLENFIYLQDKSAGIRVTLPKTAAELSLQTGRSLAVQGSVIQGDFAPMIEASNIQPQGEMPLPVPIPMSYADALSGSLDGQWVEVRGYVEELSHEGPWTNLSISTANGDFAARLYNPLKEESLLLGSTVRVNGVLITATNARRQLQSVLFIVPDERFATVEAAPLANPFDLPLSSIASLKRYRPFSEKDTYRRVRGSVTYHENGKTLFISDGVDVLQVLARNELLLVPGDVIEVVGLPQRKSQKLVLRNARIRTTGEIKQIPSSALPQGDAIDPSEDGRLVHLSGKITDTAVSSNQLRIFLNHEGQALEVKGPLQELTSVVDQLKPGSLVDLTGIYDIDFDENNKSHSVSILLRHPSDITITKGAPFWTPQRTQGTLLIILIGALAVGAWTVALRRRVAAQTQVIIQKTEKEALLEIQNREIVSKAHDFIYTIDFQGRFITYNEAGERITGYSIQDAPDITIYDLLDERVGKRVRIVLERMRETRNAVFETQLRRKDGKKVWVEISAGYIRQNGESICAFGVIHEIQARKELETELRRAKTAAEEITAAKSSFLATISHELRTPMNGIIGMTDLLLDLEVNQTAREYGETIRDSAGALLTLVNDILDLSKAEAGKLTVDPHPFPLRDTIKQALSLLEPSAAQKGVDLRCTLPNHIPENLVGDSGRLRQVILNLTGNALKFTEQGHVQFILEQEDRNSQGIEYKFQIVDTGIGIPKAAQEKLFQSFVQADASHARRFGGTGLGLKISQEIVTLMGGEIGMESEEGAGSVFWFKLRFENCVDSADETKPAARERVKAPPAPRKRSSSAPAAPAGKWTGEPVSILVAEDMPINQKVTRLQLKKMGLETDLAENGFEVLEAIEKKDYDIILMDCQMPGMDGLEASRKLRENPKHTGIHIVALTANAMEGDRERCIAAGMNDYITKPTKPANLMEAIKRFQAKATQPDG